MDTSHKEILSKLVRGISNKCTSIFCGAGISYHSGLPLASELVKKILAVLDIKEADASIIFVAKF